MQEAYPSSMRKARAEAIDREWQCSHARLAKGDANVSNIGMESNVSESEDPFIPIPSLQETHFFVEVLGSAAAREKRIANGRLTPQEPCCAEMAKVCNVARMHCASHAVKHEDKRDHLQAHNLLVFCICNGGGEFGSYQAQFSHS